MVLPILAMGGKLPDIPDPTKTVVGGIEVAKAIVTGGVSVSMDVAEGMRKVLFQSVEGGTKTIDGAVREVVNTIKANIEAGKATVESVRRDIDQAAASVLTQADQVVGQDIVRKFKAEVEKQIRQF